MSEDDIVKCVSPTEILTYKVCILPKLAGLNIAGLKWKGDIKSKPAPSVRLHNFRRCECRNVKPDSSCWYDKGDSDALTLTVSKAVLFHGVRLFGNSGGSQYKVNFKIKDENVTGTYTSQHDGDSVPGYDIILSKPIPLLPDEEITIIATIQGPNSYYGRVGKSTVKVNVDIVLTIKGAPVSKNEIGITEGQFYIFFLKFLNSSLRPMMS